MAVADINGIKCYYEVHGEGCPLMLIGGLSSDSQTWQPILNDLEKLFRVIVYDNRGCGRTEAPTGGINIPLLAEDAVSLLEYLNIEEAYITGHSMGGYVAQEIAICYPSRVGGLVLESTSSFTPERNRKLFSSMLNVWEGTGSYGVFLREFIKWLFTPEFLRDKDKVDKFVEYVEGYPFRQSKKDFKEQLEAYEEYSSLSRLTDIRARTLVIRGEKDLLVSADDSGVLAGVCVT